MLQRLKAVFEYFKSFFSTAEVKVERRVHEDVRKSNNNTNRGARRPNKKSNTRDN